MAAAKTESKLDEAVIKTVLRACKSKTGNTANVATHGCKGVDSEKIVAELVKQGLLESKHVDGRPLYMTTDKGREKYDLKLRKLDDPKGHILSFLKANPGSTVEQVADGLRIARKYTKQKMDAMQHKGEISKADDKYSACEVEQEDEEGVMVALDNARVKE